MIAKKDKHFWHRYHILKQAADASANRFEQIKNVYPPDHAIYRMIYNRMIKDSELLTNHVRRHMR